MKLSKTDRLLLFNQYEILKALYPRQKKDYEEAQEVVMHGFEHHYDTLAEHLYDNTMSDEEGAETIDILTMFDAVQRAFDDLTDKTGINEHRIAFHGFDGNNEGKYLAYAQFFCSQDNGRFVSLRKPHGFGGGVHELPRYRAMLREWHASTDKYHLTKEDLIRITSSKWGS